MADKFSEQVVDKILGQYKSSSLLVSFIQSMTDEADIIQAEIENVILNRFLLPASGVQLDILGNILGIGREVVDFIDNIFFGFLEDATAQSFGDLNSPTTGGRFRSATEADSVARELNDAEYRALLFAKITKNSSQITPDDVLSLTRGILSVLFVGGDEIPVNINELTNAAFEIQIGAELSGSDQAFIADLDLIPRPAGVRIAYLYTAPTNAILSGDGLTLFAQDGQQLEVQ